MNIEAIVARINQVLADQRRLSAAIRFSSWHSDMEFDMTDVLAAELRVNETAA